MRDKFVALTDKAALVCTLVGATLALNVVGAGTSFGVSTLYLTLVVGQDARALGKEVELRVIATENGPSKAVRAREH